MEKELDIIQSYIKDYNWCELEKYFELTENENLKFIESIVSDTLPYHTVLDIELDLMDKYGGIPELYKTPMIVTNENEYDVPVYKNADIANLSITVENRGYNPDNYGFIVAYCKDGQISVREVTEEEKKLIDAGLELQKDYIMGYCNEKNSGKEFTNPETFKIEYKNIDPSDLLKSVKMEKDYGLSSIEKAEQSDLQEIVKAYGDRQFTQEVGSMEIDNGIEI